MRQYLFRIVTVRGSWCRQIIEANYERGGSGQRAKVPTRAFPIAYQSSMFGNSVKMTNQTTRAQRRFNFKLKIPTDERSDSQTSTRIMNTLVVIEAHPFHVSLDVGLNNYSKQNEPNIIYDPYGALLSCCCDQRTKKSSRIIIGRFLFLSLARSNFMLVGRSIKYEWSISHNERLWTR